MNPGGCVSRQVSPLASLSMSLAQTDYCREQGYDPQSPLCAHIILSGSVMEVRLHARTFTRMSTRSHVTLDSSLSPGQRDGGRIRQESSVQSASGDDRVAVRSQLVLRQVQHHAGTSTAASTTASITTSTAKCTATTTTS